MRGSRGNARVAWVAWAGCLAAALPASGKDTPAGKGAIAAPVTLTVLATNDLHGALEGIVLPEAAGRGGKLGGFARVGGLLARLRAQDPEHTLVLDAGDCFQGELAVNADEGMPCARFFNAVGYDVRSLGNHEFDYFGCGPEDSARPPEDPQCALKQVLAASRQPVVATNLRQAATGDGLEWPNVVPWMVKDVGGVKVGIAGVLTPDTPKVANRAGCAGVDFRPLEGDARRAAKELRKQGATVVILLAHVSGQCGRGSRMPGPGDEGCRLDGELKRLIQALAPGEVDLVVAGHSHAWLTGEKMAVPVVETPGQGSYVGRVTIAVDPRTGRPVKGGVRVGPLVPVCREEDPGSRVCGPQYAGYAGVADPLPEVQAIVDEAQAKVASVCAEVVAEAAEDVLTRRGTETPLGNLTADLMREAAAEAGEDGVVRWADVAFTNHGSVRDSLRKGPITRCDLHRVWPFDDPLVEARMTGDEVRQLAEFWVNVVKKVPAVSGILITRYRDGKVVVRTPDHQPLDPARLYRIVTTAYLLKGGDGADTVLGRVPKDRIRILAADRTYRDAFARVMRARGRITAPALGRFEGL